MPIDCPYCKGPARLVSGRTVDPNNPEEFSSQFWLCSPCRAWVICFPRSIRPMGTPANAGLRNLRSQVKYALQPVVQRKIERERSLPREQRSNTGLYNRVRWTPSDARVWAYRRLAWLMGLEQDRIAVGQMNPVQCEFALRMIAEGKMK